MSAKHDDNLWISVGSFMLGEYFHRLPKTDLRWPPTWDVPLAPTILHDLLVQAEAPHAEEIDVAVEEWADTGLWRPMSDEAAAFLRIRWKPANYFFTDHVLPEDQGCKTIVPFPNMPPRRVIAWVLTDRWLRLGSMKACEKSLPSSKTAERPRSHSTNIVFWLWSRFSGRQAPASIAFLNAFAMRTGWEAIAIASVAVGAVSSLSVVAGFSLRYNAPLKSNGMISPRRIRGC